MEEREGFGKQEKVYRIFEEIAGRYDNANVRISLGMQQMWKKMLADRLFKDVGSMSEKAPGSWICAPARVTSRSWPRAEIPAGKSSDWTFHRPCSKELRRRGQNTDAEMSCGQRGTRWRSLIRTGHLRR